MTVNVVTEIKYYFDDSPIGYERGDIIRVIMKDGSTYVGTLQTIDNYNHVLMLYDHTNDITVSLWLGAIEKVRKSGEYW